MEEAEQEITLCTEGTSLEAPLAFTCTHRGAFWVQLPYTGARGGFTGKTIGVQPFSPPHQHGVFATSVHIAIIICCMHRHQGPLSLGKAFQTPAPGAWLPFLPQTSSFSSVPQSLSCTSLDPKPTDVSGSFKSCFPALPANTFNPQSLTTSYGDGMVNAGLQTLSHLPKITP